MLLRGKIYTLLTFVHLHDDISERSFAEKSMEKHHLIIGRKKEYYEGERNKSHSECIGKTKETGENSGFEWAMMTLGLAAVCFVIVTAVGWRENISDTGSAFDKKAVSVASIDRETIDTACREKLTAPEKPDMYTSVGERSIFDYIGELFAELIFGE